MDTNYNRILNDFRDTYGFTYIDQNMFGKMKFIILTGRAMNIIHKKNPNITFPDFLRVALKGLGFKDNEILRIAATCETFSYNTYEYPDLHVQQNKIISELRNIGSKWLPF